MKKKTWPSAKQVKMQFLIAVLLTFCAVFDGIVMLKLFSPEVVLCEIVLVGCAVLQWCIYFYIKSKLEIKELLTESGLLKENEGDALRF